MVATHMPFPSVGHVAVASDAFPLGAGVLGLLIDPK
jgi:hypothetical protein